MSAPLTRLFNLVMMSILCAHIIAGLWCAV
jgi:hypothetical protein